MNERIRELAEQSMELIDISMKLGMPGTDLVFNKEKFAELIVQDCLSVLNKRYMGDQNREDMEVRRCVADVKKHFGVEEWSSLNSH